MRGRCRAADPRPDSPAAGATAGNARKKGPRSTAARGGQVYLGVRVKMPVKELLKNIRVAKGEEDPELKEPSTKRVKGDMKRVKTRLRRSSVQAPHAKSLEELAFIIEVLEEDLRSASFNPPSDPPTSPQLSPAGGSNYDDIIPSPGCYASCSPAERYQAPSPPALGGPAPPHPVRGNVAPPHETEWPDPHGSAAFFWTQLQREERQLAQVSDAALLSADEHSRRALHKVAWVGKRALGYAIAKRMAALHSLDLKDSDGMTALHYAAKHNHHLMVADLIRLGANVNETNNAGKSCLHLSAENGYVRVLEVLKQAMMDGVYVDVEAADNAGLSVLQSVAVALKRATWELEGSSAPGHAHIHLLRRQQMMETLECLLLMGSFLHCARGAGLCSL